MRKTGRCVAILMALGLAMASMPSIAEGQPRAARRNTERVSTGDGLVVARSVAQGTLTVDDRTFAVDARTRILDLEEKPIPLAKVPLRTDPPFTMNQTEPGAVRYRAVQGRNGWTLVEVRLVEAEPR